MNTRTLRAIPAALLVTTAAAWCLPAAALSSVGMESSRSAPAVATSRSEAPMNVAQASGNSGGLTSNPNGSPGAPSARTPPAIVPAMPASTASGAAPTAPQGMAPGSGSSTGTSGTMPAPAMPAPKR
ncbi:MAG: hypothetical protein WBC18_19780 [Ottowia sp.]|uniref:hypothetical protein n=1 Tax=Ottowia sp. VDI28 TaxID=3133968 RepID=UPI003C2CE0F0